MNMMNSTEMFKTFVKKKITIKDQTKIENEIIKNQPK